MMPQIKLIVIVNSAFILSYSLMLSHLNVI